jgi:hypothetical protein
MEVEFVSMQCALLQTMEAYLHSGTLLYSHLFFMRNKTNTVVLHNSTTFIFNV